MWTGGQYNSCCNRKKTCQALIDFLYKLGKGKFHLLQNKCGLLNDNLSITNTTYFKLAFITFSYCRLHVCLYYIKTFVFVYLRVGRKKKSHNLLVLLAFATPVFPNSYFNIFSLFMDSWTLVHLSNHLSGAASFCLPVHCLCIASLPISVHFDSTVQF